MRIPIRQNCDPTGQEAKTATQALPSKNHTFTRTHCAKRCLQPISQQELIANQMQLGRSDWESEWVNFSAAANVGFRACSTKMRKQNGGIAHRFLILVRMQMERLLVSGAYGSRLSRG